MIWTSTYYLNKACNKIFPLLENETTQKYLVLDPLLLNKINNIFHLSGNTSISLQLELINKIESFPNVSFVYYHLDATERFMDFTKMEIVFKRNT